RGVVEGLVPRYLPPLAFAACAGADQRFLEARGVVNLQHAGIPARAEHAARFRIFRIRIELANQAVLYQSDDRALIRTELARGGDLAPLSHDSGFPAAADLRGRNRARARNPNETPTSD